MSTEFDEPNLSFDRIFAWRLVEEKVANLPKDAFFFVVVAVEKQDDPNFIVILG